MKSKRVYEAIIRLVEANPRILSKQLAAVLSYELGVHHRSVSEYIDNLVLIGKIHRNSKDELTIPTGENLPTEEKLDAQIQSSTTTLA
jgi:Mn-dependent DtxR family transcriptional regulator